MPSRPDLDHLRAEVAAALAAHDPVRARHAIRASAHHHAIEDGAGFRRLVTELPGEVWHDDAIVTAALGTSYRAPGSPQGGPALAYIEAAQRMLAEDAPVADRAAIMIAAGAALRTQGRLAEAAARLGGVSRLLDAASPGPLVIALSARHALETGVVDLLLGDLDDARRRLELAHGLSAQLTPRERLECLGALALAAYAQGDLHATDRLLDEFDAAAPDPESLDSGFAAAAYAARIAIATDRYRVAHLPDYAEAMVSASAGTEWEPLAGVFASYARAIGGEPIVALDLLQRAHQRYLTWQPPGIGLDLATLLRGDILGTLDRGEEAFELLNTLNPHERHALCPARFVARNALWHGDLTGAATALAGCERLGEGHSPRTLIDVQLLLSAVDLERGDRIASDLRFDRAVHAMLRTGVRSSFRLIPFALLDQLAQRAVDRAQDPEVVGLLTRLRGYTSGHAGIRDPLSERERLILVHVERELTVAQIAAELYISPNTVKTHLRRIYQKLGVTTRAEAIRKARSLGLHAGGADFTRESPDLRDAPTGV